MAKKKLNLDQKRALRAEDVRLFVKQIGRQAQSGKEPNDRRHSREIERRVQHMTLEEFDQMLRDGEED